MESKIIKNERGSVLLWTMMFMALFFITVSTVAVTTILEIRQSTKIDSSTKAYLLAEAGAERAKNYADSGNETMDTDGVNTFIHGQIGGSTNTYQFQVIKAPVGQTTEYDDPIRYCVNTSGSTTKYCYYSQGTVGNNIRRKIDGSKSDIPLSQGNSIPLYNGGANLITDAGFDDQYLDLMGNYGSTFTPPANPSTYILTGTFDLGSFSGMVQTGLLDTSSHKAVGLSLTSSFDIALYNFTMQSSGLTFGSRSSSSISVSPSSLPADSDGNQSIRFLLTYRKGTLSSNTSATLKISDINGQCLGIVTYNYVSTDTVIASPTKSFYVNSWAYPQFEMDSTNIKRTGRIKLKYGASTIFEKNLFFSIR